MKRAFVLTFALLSFFMMTACSVLEDYSKGSSEGEIYHSSLSEAANTVEDSQPANTETVNVSESEGGVSENEKKETTTLTKNRVEETQKKAETKEQKPTKEEVKKEDKEEKQEKKQEEEEKKEENSSPLKEQEEKKSDEDKEGKQPLSQTKKASDLFIPQLKGDYKNLSNEKKGWYYQPKKNFSKDKSTIPSEIAVLLDRYGALWQADTGENKLYLTFDEGYEYKDNTKKILDTLKAKEVKAAFFVTGAYVKAQPELVKRMAKEGHLVCSHSVNHLNQVEALKTEGKLEADVFGLESMMEEIVGFQPAKYFRPPEGVYSEATLAFLAEAGYKPVFWSFAYRDWLTDNQPTKEAAIEKITGQFHSGSILLLHAVSETNVAVLPDVIDKAIEAGYTFSSLSDL